MRSVALVSVFVFTLALALASNSTSSRADVGPTARPTMFLVVQRDGMSVARLRTVRAALLRTLPRLSKRFLALLITEGAGLQTLVVAASSRRIASRFAADRKRRRGLLRALAARGSERAARALKR